jgi:enoyl-[acyl-carrier protein] reductase I
MSFLQLAGKTFVVTGVGSRRSVAWHVGRVLEEQGAAVVYTVRSAQRRAQMQRLLGDREVHVCDVRQQQDIDALVRVVGQGHPRIHGLVHSIAFANYESFTGRFHEVRREDFLQAVDISCFSLIALAGAFQPLFDEQASVVTLSISTAHMAAESYGYLAPAKAALDSAVTFLAKSFSRTSKVRFNAVKAGLLKTNASAGIPDYLQNYLFAELATLRKQALTCEEVANVAAFLLSPRSSGINAQGVVVDCGMACNYFDSSIVGPAVQAAWPTGAGGERAE